MKQMQDRMVLGLVLTLVAGGVCFADSTTDYTAERYKVILDRSPFGEPLTTGVTTQNTDAQARKTAAVLEQSYRLSYLSESENGEMQAGFQNLKPKKGDPRSSVVMVGESFMGMKLTSVDLASSEATLEHNGQPVTFQLIKQKTPAKTVPVKPTPQRKFGGGFRQTSPPKQPQPQLSPAEQEQRRAEIRKNLQDYQMEVIRKGMPPLPVPLTQEMDDQLVSEGVLPPVE